VLCLNEKNEIQARDSTQGGLLLTQGCCGTMKGMRRQAKQESHQRYGPRAGSAPNRKERVRCRKLSIILNRW
jgi:hypothetical protein